MARMNKLDSIENQIKKKQDKLFELKEQSDAIVAEIQELIKQREAIRKEALLSEIENSGRTYEEIIEFLQSTPKRNVAQPKVKRKYTRRKPVEVD